MTRMDIPRYSKLIAAFLGAVTAAVADNVLDLNDAVTVLVALIPAVAVYFAPANTEPPANT